MSPFEKNWKECLRKMEDASRAFYIHHAFIEFTGLMNEYIKVSDGSKLDCIYGVEFSQRKG